MKARIFGFVFASALAFSTPASANLGGILDGMFSNVTAPGAINNQLRGGLSGGSIYIRSPIKSIQVLAIDPPRLSPGCGGIDLFFGSFSFISAEKLSQFVRAIAQNAAPLAFKMAINAAFPQLGGLLAEFERIAQEMTSLMKNSCQMARGLVSAADDPKGAMEGLSKAVSSSLGVAKGWYDDISSAAMKVTEKPSESARKANALRTPAGVKSENTLGNLTWNALNQRSANGYTFDIAFDVKTSKEILMSLIGTQIKTEGATDDEDIKVVSYKPTIRLSNIFRPEVNSDGTMKGIMIYTCNNRDAVNPPTDCLAPTDPNSFSTTGIEGYVRKNMLGSETASTPLDGSIIQKMKQCRTGNCGLTATQFGFLNSIGNIPVIGLLRRSQKAEGAMDTIARELIGVLTDEVSVAYGKYVLDMARTTFTGNNIAHPPYYDQTIAHMVDDIDLVASRSVNQMVKITEAARYIDIANNSRPGALSYRPGR
jgi:conjugative transfer pilus assembly protein TraH